MCHKKPYKDIKAARGAIRAITRGDTGDHRKPVRAYLCPACGKYHLTSEKKKR